MLDLTLKILGHNSPLSLIAFAECYRVFAREDESLCGTLAFTQRKCHCGSKLQLFHLALSSDMTREAELLRWPVLGLDRVGSDIIQLHSPKTIQHPS